MHQRETASVFRVSYQAITLTQPRVCFRPVFFVMVLALAAQLSGLFGTSITIIRLVEEIKDCHNEAKTIHKLSVTAEASVFRVTSAAERFAALAVHQPEHNDKLYRIALELDRVKDSLEKKKAALQSKTKAGRFFSATKTSATLKTICTRLEHMESDLDIVSMVGEVDRKMELIARGLATLLEKFGNAEEGELLRREVAQCSGFSTVHNNVGDNGLFVVMMGRACMNEGEFDKAVKYFREAMQRGNADASYWMGVLTQKGGGLTQNDAQSFEYFLAAANSGHAEALHKVGESYFHGHGVAKNVTEAFNSYTSAASRGSSNAMVEAGICYMQGTGTDVDLFQAAGYFLEAAECDHMLGLTLYANCLIMGQGLPRNAKLGVELIKFADEAGCLDATVILGLCYEEELGVKKDQAEAVKLYRKAAKLGDKKAMARLGRCLVEGIGGVQDVALGVRYLRVAIKANVPRAWMTYGYLLSTGMGMDRNQSKALRCFKRAAAGGLISAHTNLGISYLFAKGVPRNVGTAIRHFRHAASYNLMHAQWMLALIFENDEGVPKQVDRAMYYFHRLAQMGHIPAHMKTTQYILEGCGVQRPRITKTDRTHIENAERLKRRFLRKSK